jgi:hypothetical protein
MVDTAKIGSSEWFTQQADKLLGLGMDILKYKTTTGSTSASTQATPTTTASTLSGKLPYILGGLAVVGIGIILWKR